MNFGEAQDLLRNRKRISRKGWNGKGMFVIQTELYTKEGIKIDNECYLLKNVKGSFNTWIPSITDLNANDWEENK